MRTVILRAAISLAVLYAICVAALAWAMRQPPEEFGRIMSKMPVAAYIVLPFETLWMRARAGGLNTGDVAPDFALKALDKSTQVQLSAFRGRQPVVLVFGSYT